MCVGRSPTVNHQEFERLDIGEITEATTVNTVKRKEHCAQIIISELEDQRAQINIPESNTRVIEVEIHAERNDAQHMLHFEEAQVLSDTERNDAQHMVHFEEAQDLSDAGSLITQAPQSNPIHATINALSTWMAAIQPRESWYLLGWIRDSPIDFLVDPGAVVSAISLQCYEKLVETDAILMPMKAMQMELEAMKPSNLTDFMQQQNVSRKRSILCAFHHTQK